jgi:hypothetical protein
MMALTARLLFVVVKIPLAKLNMFVHTYNPSTEEVRQEDCKLEISLGYIARPVSKKKKSSSYNTEGNANEWPLGGLLVPCPNGASAFAVSPPSCANFTLVWLIT